MGMWDEFKGLGSQGPSGDKQDAHPPERKQDAPPPERRLDALPERKQDAPPPEQTYFGLTATQFNVAVFAVIGAIALVVGLFLFGGAGAVQDMFGGDDDASPRSVAVVRTVVPTVTAAPSTPIPSPTSAPTPAGDVDRGTGQGDGGAVGQVLNTFDPLTLMGALGSSSSVPDVDITGPGGATSVPTDQADDALKMIPLREGDLPTDFQSFGEMSFSVPTENGTADMVASMFATSDLNSNDFGNMVMSAVIVGPDIASEFGDIDEMGEITQADLNEAAAAMEEFGVALTELEILDASGLGDAGMGIHMVMDFSGMFEALGAPPDESMPDGIAWDMYVFVRGERALMVMVMWPSDEAARVDALALAEIMDARATSS